MTNLRGDAIVIGERDQEIPINGIGMVMVQQALKNLVKVIV